MLGIIVIGIPLLIYVIGAFSVKKSDLKHPDDFFTAYKKVGTTAFSSSSIAYAFQVSTIYPFLLWGASNFFLIPAVNTLCWGLGIFLFYLCFNRYRRFIGQDVTLHGFLGAQYGHSVRITASYLTIIGFLGFAVAETYFGSKVLLALIDNKTFLYTTIVVTLLFVFGYIAYGGQMSSIRTDQLQLIISYTGVFGIMIYFLYLLIAHGSPVPGFLSISFVLLVIYIPFIFVYRRFQFIRFSETDSLANRTINRVANYVVTALLLLLLILVLLKLVSSGISLNVPKFFNLEGFGVLGLLSLIVLPLCWQFVDLTNWQRLLSVKPDEDSNEQGSYRNIRRGLLIYAIESPFTWLIFLFFGLLAVSSLPHFTFTDLLVDIPKQLIRSNILAERVVGFSFIMSVLAIMLSTIDSFIVGIIFTFVYDANRKTRKMLESSSENEQRQNYRAITNAGKLFGLAAILLGAALFIVFDQHIANGGELFINLLLAFYSAQLSFFPLIFGILFVKKRISAAWANASMIAGATGGIFIGVYAVIWNQTYIWYPVLTCVVLSALVYLAGLIMTSNEQHA